MNADLVVPGLFCTLPGSLTVVWQARLLVAAVRSTRYIPIKGRIKRKATFAINAQIPDLVSALVYKYTAGGREYDGYRVGFGRFGGSRYGSERYQEGKSVTVWYDPEHPERAVLETGPTAENYILLALGLLLFGIGAVFLIAAF